MQESSKKKPATAFCITSQAREERSKKQPIQFKTRERERELFWVCHWREGEVHCARVINTFYSPSPFLLNFRYDLNFL